MKRNLLTLTFLIFVIKLNAQNPAQNCLGAIPICQPVYTQSNSFNGVGSLNELNPTNQGCLTTGEFNSVWYIVNVATPGSFVFTLTPANPSTDYDFAVWDLTDKSCDAIANGLAPIRCNYASLAMSSPGGLTGLSTSSIQTSIGAGGPSFSSSITASAGQTFVILINNSSASTAGYSINFSASTCQILDNVSPVIKSDTLAVSCTGPSSIKLLLSENVTCNSLSTSGSEFSLTPAVATVIGAGSLSCSAGGSFTNLISLTFSAPLSPGTYLLSVLNGGDGNTLIDNCGNAMQVGTSIGFTVNAPLQMSVATQYGCPGTASGVINISGSGGVSPYVYRLNAGSYVSNNVFSALLPGTYTVTIKDSIGCIRDTIVNLANSSSIQFLSVAVNNVTCFGANNGSILVNASGGTPPLNYAIGASTYSSSNLINNLSPGNHLLHVMDANGCVKDTLLFISSPGQLSFNSINITPATCGTNNASIAAIGFGGVSPVQYSLNSGAYQAGGSFANLTAGSYLLRLKDANNCTKDTILNLPQISQVIISNVIITQPGCAGSSGSILVNGSMGTGPYSYSLNGAPFTTSSSFTSLASGTYTVTIKDANTCTSSSIVTLVSPGNLFFSNSSVVLPTCLNAGSITVNGAGGSAPYQFALGTGFYSSVNTFTSLVPGTYLVHLKDNNGCVHDSIINLPAVLIPTVTSSSTVNPSCSFPSAGSFTVNASGGLLPLQYSVNGSAFTSQTIYNSLSGGIYTVVVKDANGCTVSSLVALNTINALQFVTASSTNIGCAGSPLGSIQTALSVGNPPYQYSINGSPFQANGNFSGLSAGSFTVTGLDASGCTKTTVFLISSSATLAFSSVNITSSVCYEPPTGSISVTGVASALPITYSLNSGIPITSGLFGLMNPGTYLISLHDANGCRKDSLVNLGGPSPMYFTNTQIMPPPCAGGTGSISLSGAGGLSPYQYSINGVASGTSSSWPSLVAGTYTIRFTDANGCEHDTVIELIEPPPLAISSLVALNASCTGASTGSIAISIVSGVLPYLYSINASPPGTISSWTGLGSGNYFIQVIDSNGCIKDTLITLSNNGNFQLSQINTTPPSCHSYQDGSVSLGSTGGTPPYQYAINTGPFTSSNTFFNLGAGTYTLHAKDNSGCFDDSIITISQPTNLAFGSVQLTPPSCAGSSNGILVVSAAGGTPNYIFSLNGGSSTTSFTFNGLISGLHQIEIIDANGCEADTSILLGQPPPLLFNNVNIIHPGCLGVIGVISLNATGGVAPYTFAIGSGAYSASGMFNNLPVGTYTLHVKDNNGCIHDTVISLISNQVIGISSVLSSPVICHNTSTGFIQASGTSSNPPLNYSLNGGATQSSGMFTGLGAGSYLLHVEDLIGCFIDTLITIQSTPPILLNSISIIPATCYTSNDGSITINAIGGLGTLRYACNTSSYFTSNTFSNLTAGNYTLHVKDSLSCQKDTVVAVLSPPAIVFTSVNLILPYCSNATTGKITINVSGGQPPYLYAINSSLFTTSNLFQNLFPGTYTLQVKDFNGCIKDTVIFLPSSNYIDFTNVVVNAVSCKNGNDGSISLGISGGFSPYTFTINSVFNGTSTFFGNLGAGVYTIQVTDTLGCQADTIIQVSEPLNPLNALILNTEPNKCRGDSIGVINAGGAGGTPPYSYSLDAVNFQTSPVFPGLPAGTFLITIKDNLGCLDDTTATVTEPDTSVQLTLQSIKDVSCIGVDDGAITVTSKYGYQPIEYYFNGVAVGSDTVYSNLAPGNYIVEVRDSMGCKSTGKFIIQPSDRRPYIIIDSIHGILCAGDLDGAIDWHAINTFPPYYYYFDSQNIDTVSIMTGITNGLYLIEVTDSIGCRADTTIRLQEGDQLELQIQTTPALCQGLGDDGMAKAIVIGGVQPFTFAWNGQAGNTTDHATQLWYGEQVATVTDGLGCSDSAHFFIEYDPCCVVNLPNAFTPNNDGKNDLFSIIRYGYISLVSFDIYNRWGNRVFTASDVEAGWDGKYKGVDCDLGTYFYLLRFRCRLKNEIIMMKGDVILVR